jgi:hypothetical protein
MNPRQLVVRFGENEMITGDHLVSLPENVTEEETESILKIVNHRNFFPVPATFTDFDHLFATQLPYRQHVYTHRTVAHDGHRKLALSLVQFMTRHGHRSHQVIFVTNSLCRMFPVVAALFPKHNFHIFDMSTDPKPLAKDDADQTGLCDVPNITWHTAFDPQSIRPRSALFISDFATRVDDCSQSSRSIALDLDLQRNWVDALHPVAFSLKFRVPYSTDTFEFFDGDMYFQPWSGATATETRLVGTDAVTRNYTVKDIENRFFFVNTVLREWGSFQSDQSGNYDFCFDCALEQKIWRQYLRIRGRPIGPQTTCELGALLTAIGSQIDCFPHYYARDMLRFVQREAQIRTNQITSLMPIMFRRPRDELNNTSRQDVRPLPTCNIFRPNVSVSNPMHQEGVETRETRTQYTRRSRTLSQGSASAQTNQNTE